MARFTHPGIGGGSGGTGPQGDPGPQGEPGPAGANGADALWNFVGEYNNGADYNIGDVVTYSGGTYYRVGEPNPGYPPGTSYWTTIAEPGQDGADGQDANLDTGTTTINSYNPVWSGTGLTYTNTPATGSYIKIGNLVQVQIDVLFSTVTNFGTGQYSLTLPLPSKYHTDVYGGSIHNITNQGIDHYSLKGHLSPASSTITVWNIGSSAQDQPFDHNSPFVLETTDRFHMSFSYICE
jgi:hypothetical protein